MVVNFEKSTMVLLTCRAFFCEIKNTNLSNIRSGEFPTGSVRVREIREHISITISFDSSQSNHNRIHQMELQKEFKK